METLKAIAVRKSIREFKAEQIPEEALDIILNAGCAAPIGFGEYDSLHFTVVQDEDVLQNIKDVAMHCFRDPLRDIYYGAPTVIVISTNHSSVPELDMANAGCIAENMMLAAVDLGLDCIYIWGTVLAFRADPDLADEIDLPDGFVPIASVALGYAVEPDHSEREWSKTIRINRV